MPCRDGEISPRLQPALEALSASLQTLSASLDAVVFSDTWRAAAIAITRTMFNDVATEAHFSAEVSACPMPELPENLQSSNDSKHLTQALARLVVLAIF